MVTVDGAGFSHKLLEHLDALAARRGYTLVIRGHLEAVCHGR
jgi:hypothetical protein